MPFFVERREARQYDVADPQDMLDFLGEGEVIADDVITTPNMGLLVNPTDWVIRTVYSVETATDEYFQRAYMPLS